jgi:hypothetical protein
MEGEVTGAGPVSGSGAGGGRGGAAQRAEAAAGGRCAAEGPRARRGFRGAFANGAKKPNYFLLVQDCLPTADFRGFPHRFDSGFPV